MGVCLDVSLAREVSPLDLSWSNLRHVLPEGRSWRDLGRFEAFGALALRSFLERVGDIGRALF